MKKNISVFIIVLLLLTVIPTVAFADSYDSGTTTVTIDGAGGMPLQAAVEAALAAEGSDTAADITHLNIADGVVYTLTGADIDYIDTALTAMTHLSTGDSVLFNYNGDGTLGDVGAGFLFQNAVIQSVSLINAETFGDNAFRECYALASVNLPAAESFGDGAFWSCDVLTTISLPLAETFGSAAFYSCSVLTTISLPAAKTFGDGAFYSCPALTTASLPLAETFGVSAFAYCYAIETVILPAATTFGNSAFWDCDGPISLTLGSTLPPATASTFGTVPVDTDSTVYVPLAAQSAYLAVADGDTTDGLWWGWTVQGIVENPDTGDSGYTWIYIAALALLLGFAGVFAFMKSKKLI